MKKMRICSWIVMLCLLASSGTVLSAGLDDVYATLGGEPVKSDQVIVEITAPAAGSVVYYNYQLTVEASVEARDAIERVEFYRGRDADPFATDTDAPYSGVTACGADAFTVYAKAYTTTGLYGVSKAAQVTVDDSVGYVERTYLDATFDGSAAVPEKIDLQDKGETSEIIPAPMDAEGNTRDGNVVHLSVGSPAVGAPWADYVDRTTPLSGTVVIEISIMSETDTWPGKKNAWFQFYNTEGKEAGTLMEFNGKTINSFPASGRNSVVSQLEAMRWYDLKFVIDFDQRTYTVDVDGANKGGVLSLPNAASDNWSQIAQIRNRTGEAGYGMYIDNWKIYTQPKTHGNTTYVDASFDGSAAAPAGFILDAKGATASIVPSPEDYTGTAKPGNSILVASQDTTKAPLVDYNISPTPAAGVVIFEANILPAAEKYPKAVELFYLTSETGNIARLAKLENQDINYWNGKSRMGNAVKSYVPGKWYHMKYTVNTTEMSYDLEIDGTSVVKGVKISPESNAAQLGGIKVCRFRIGGESAVDNTSLYIDDWKIYGLPSAEAAGAVFTSDSGLLSVDRAKAPPDLRCVTVDFSDEMDADSFSGVTVTNTATGEPVPFTGAYLAATRQYVVSLADALKEKTSYDITFPTSVKNTAGIGLTGAATISFTTTAPDVKITGTEFLGADGQPLNKSATGGTITARVSTESFADSTKTLCLVLTVYRGDTLMSCAVNSQPSLPAGDTGTFDVTLEQVAGDLTGCDIRLFVWNDFDQIWPICEPILA